MCPNTYITPLQDPNKNCEEEKNHYPLDSSSFRSTYFFRLTDYHTTDTQTYYHYYYHNFFICFLFWKKYGYDIGRSSCSLFGCYYPNGGFHAYLDIWCQAGTDDDFESNDVIVLSVLLRLIDEEEKIVYEKLL